MADALRQKIAFGRSGVEPNALAGKLARSKSARPGGAGLGSVGILDGSYRARILRFCRGYLGTVAEAEDAVQDILCTALEAPALRGNFRTWIYAVARNYCLNRLRERRRRPQRPPAWGEWVTDSADALSGLIKAEQQSRLAQAVGLLRPGEYEVLRLRYVDGLSRAEIGVVLGIPESTVKSRLGRALRHLRDRVWRAESNGPAQATADGAN